MLYWSLLGFITVAGVIMAVTPPIPPKDGDPKCRSKWTEAIEFGKQQCTEDFKRLIAQLDKVREQDLKDRRNDFELTIAGELAEVGEDAKCERKLDNMQAKLPKALNDIFGNIQRGVIISFCSYYRLNYNQASEIDRENMDKTILAFNLNCGVPYHER